MTKQPKVYAVIGTQFGDEAKGKIGYHLAPDVEWCVRFNGGNNAGHTVEGNKFHYLSGGIIRDKKVGIGNGMVIHPPSLFEELTKNRLSNDLIKQVYISERAHVTLPSHFVLDGVYSITQGDLSAKSTYKGIAPTYGDKAARFGLTFSDLLDHETLCAKMKTITAHHKKIFNAYSEHLDSIKEEMTKRLKPNGKELFEKGVECNSTQLAEEYLAIGKELSSNICDLSNILTNAYFEKKQGILFEGAQGFHLDVDLGIYPFGTSSNMFSIESDTGFPLGRVPHESKKIIGIVKLPMSRVGGGCKPTKIGGELEELLRQQGNEFGTTTGRPRDVCWPCEVMVRNAIRQCGITDLAIVKTDVFGGLNEPIKVNESYTYQEFEFVDALPASMTVFEKMKPNYRLEEPWSRRSEEEWNDAAQQCITALEPNHRTFLANFAKKVNIYGFLFNGDVTVSLGPSDKATFTIPFDELTKEASI
jgi:adenylosuccinate synthase